MDFGPQSEATPQTVPAADPAAGNQRGQGVARKSFRFEPWLADRREELLFLVFLWAAALILYVLGTIDESVSAAGALAMFSGLGLLLLSLGGFLLVAAVRPLRALPFAFLLIAICCPPLLLSPVNKAGFALLDLYLISFVALPVFFRVSTAGASTITSIVCGVMACYCGIRLPHGGDFFAIALVPVAGAVAIAASITNPARNFYQRQTSGERINTKAGEEYPYVLVRRFWLTAMLLLTLLLIILFFGLAITARPLIESAPTIYTIVVFLVGCFLMSAISPRYFILSSQLLLSGGVVSIALLTYQGPPGIFHPALPVVFALLCTALVPWSTGQHVTLMFWSIVGSVLVILARDPQAGYQLAGLGSTLVLYKPDIVAVVLCGTLAVLISKFFHSRPAAIAAAGPGAEGWIAGRKRELIRPQVEGVFHLALPARLAVSKIRSAAMVSNILLLVGLSNLVVALMVARQSGIPGTLAAVSAVGGIMVWSALNYYNQRAREKEPVWFFAGFVTIALLSLPSVLLAWHPEGFDLWFLWLLCIFIGIGLSPWRLVELVPISIAVLIIGLVVAEELQDPPHGELVYSINLLLAIAASVQTSHRAKNSAVLGQIEPALISARSAEDVVSVIADHLAELFEAPYVLIRTNQEQLLVVSSGTVLSMPAVRWPLNQVADRARNLPPDQLCNPELLRGLPASWDFFDPASGLISIRSAILFRLPRTGSGSQYETGCPAILVPTILMLPQTFLRAELAVAEALAGIGRLRSEAILQRELHDEAALSMERAQAERESELGTLVHDINNTVQDLTVLCDLLIEDSPEGNGFSVAGTGHATVRRIAEIARSMAAVVSDAKRKRELEMLSDLRPRETVNVAEVLTEILSFARIRGERKRIDVSGPEGFDESVFVRVSAREHLETILRNLLNNAMSYSDPGSSIKVSVEFDAEWVRIKVTDNGRGLTVEECDAIFTTGFRGQASRGVAGGLGIGLAQSRRVAESAGGRLVAESAGVNQGSTFIVELPRSAEQQQAAFHRAWALVVDDQPALVDFYRRIAIALSIPPLAAASYPEAIDLLTINGRPSFVLTDIHLGNSSGLDLVRFIRKQFGSSVRILVISGLTGEGIEQQARSAGADDFVAKPVGRRALYARIQSLLSLN